ncbi:MAG: 50S ribosomal protein L15 [Phototrophicales bacterium]|nr:MAG: 50S ribosomal protein L15 [Phototrophicales bacterium]
MKLHDLKPDKGSKRRKKRVGLGHAAGQGKTAGRGTKGQGSRRGGGKGPYFEGGQLPLVRRMPFKRGFNNIFRIEYQEVNVETLQERFQDGETVTPTLLAQRGLIRDENDPVVILGRGELSRKLTVQAHRFTKSAQEKIEGAGGTVEKLELLVTGARATVKKLRKEQLEALRAQKASGDQ